MRPFGPKLASMDPTTVSEIVGSEIRAWRAKRGISRLALARMTGIGPRSLLRYEEGEREIGVAQLVRICAELNVPLATFFGRISDELAASRSPRSAADIAASFGI